MLQTALELDECCGPHWEKALQSGQLEAVDSWTCPDCGCTWTAQVTGEIRVWYPRVEIVVFR